MRSTIFLVVLTILAVTFASTRARKTKQIDDDVSVESTRQPKLARKLDCTKERCLKPDKHQMKKWSEDLSGSDEDYDKGKAKRTKPIIDEDLKQKTAKFMKKKVKAADDDDQDDWKLNAKLAKRKNIPIAKSKNARKIVDDDSDSEEDDDDDSDELKNGGKNSSDTDEDDDDSQEEDEKMAKKKKSKYSIKFSHEKQKSRADTDSNVKRLHKGDKYNKNLADDDDSSEEVVHAKRIYFKDDDDDY